MMAYTFTCIIEQDPLVFNGASEDFTYKCTQAIETLRTGPFVRRVNDMGLISSDKPYQLLVFIDVVFYDEADWLLFFNALIEAFSEVGDVACTLNSLESMSVNDVHFRLRCQDTLSEESTWQYFKRHFLIDWRLRRGMFLALGALCILSAIVNGLAVMLVMLCIACITWLATSHHRIADHI